MSINNLEKKRIGILGLGIENYALVKFLLKKKVKCEITICDARSKEQLGKKYNELSKKKNIAWRLGKEFDQRLFEFDVLFRSPGWPIWCEGIQEAVMSHITHHASRSTQPCIENARGKHITRSTDFVYSPMKLFFDMCPTGNIIGVTGTKGKGTISSLIYGILKEAGKRVWLGGNIGVAPFAFIEKIKKSDWVVLELSSFQLEDLHTSPHIAVINNFTREHLQPADPNNPNFHRTMGEYWSAKANIFKHQSVNDRVVVGRKLFAAKKNQIKTKAKVIVFDKSEIESRLIGEHNKENIAAAVAVGKILKIKDDIIKKAVAKFKGLEHRIEFVADKNGVKYYDDSFATTPEAAITALKSFSAPIILLAGGADKGADFKQFAREIIKRSKYVILFAGQATPRLKQELLQAGYIGENIKTVKSMKEAIEIAQKKSVSGDIILLSTGCASFGMFKNYKERGNLFKNEVIK